MRRPRVGPMGQVCLRLATALAIVLFAMPLGRPAAPAEEVLAEPPNGQVEPEQVTAEQLRVRLGEIGQSETLDDAEQARLTGLYEQALGELDLASKRAAEAATFDKMIQTAAVETSGITEQLNTASTAPAVVPPAYADLSELRRRHREAAEAWERAKEVLASREAEPKRRADRKKEIPALLTAKRDEAASLSLELPAPGPEGPPDVMGAAQRAVLLARRQRIEQEIATLQRELAAYDATSDLLRLQRDLADRQASEAKAAVDAWNDHVQQRVKEQGEDDTQQALSDRENALPALRPLADTTCKYAQESEELAGDVRTSSAQLDAVRGLLEDLEKQFARSRKRCDTAGLTYAIGLSLRNERANLPDRESYDRRRRARQPKIRDTHLRLLELDDLRAEMANLDRLVEAELERVGPDLMDMDPADTESTVRDLLTKQRNQLDTLIRNCDACFETLVQLDEWERLLIWRIDDYADYIDERVFWISSTEPLRGPDAESAADALAWLARWQNWREFGRAVIDEVKRHPVLNLSAVCVLGLLLWWQRRLRRRLAELGELAGRSTFCEVFPTCQALGATLLVAAMLPGVLALLGWRLMGSFGPSGFVRAVATGLVQTAAVFFSLEFARQVCRVGGLGEAHFGWPAGALGIARRNLRWLIVLVLPCVLLAAVLHAQDNEGYHNSLGRMSSMAALLVVAVFAHRVLRPSGEFYRQTLAAGREGWPFRLRHLWYVVGVPVPLVLAILAGVGYYYTSSQLAVRLWASACVPFALAVIGALLGRWVMVVQRRLAIERSRQRSAAAAAEEVAGGEMAAVGRPPVTPMVEVDLVVVTAQSRRLIHSFLVVLGAVCLLAVWADALPALGVLERVPVWPPSAWAGGEAGPGAVGADITLADLGLAVVVVVMTVIASKNVPGLLEISIPQRLPIDAGARYAIASVSRYAITLVGLLAVCSLLGIQWSAVQWLVAALGVGLGFGLQEVFANFICGLILLLERPIRLGDVVTVADVTGVVSRIQIRATTITNWDRKELIVPNKEFITGRLLNWTLSDPTNRVVVNVGVAYGSDTNRARDLLLEVARDHPLVMDDPAPSVTFDQFGDSSLNLCLRCFLPNVDHRLQVTHDLHSQIHKVFRSEGIEIAFPQHDLHLRSGWPPTGSVSRQGDSPSGS